MSNEVVLFDLPSRGKSACWSLNPWKTRSALNYKGIPYRTEWTEYPDLAPKFKSLGVPANSPDVGTDYTSPAVRLPDGRYVMDSRKIIDELEKLQPTPSLHLDNGYIDRTQDLVTSTHRALAPIAVPRVPERLLNDSSAKYFSATREERFGMPLPELAKSDKAGETAWKAAEPHLNGLKELLHENPSGPFIAGSEISYADLVLGGFWVFEKRLGEEDIFGRIIKYDEAFKKHYEAVAEYYSRDGH